jgi:8-amino-7-oxononanoate synthase
MTSWSSAFNNEAVLMKAAGLYRQLRLQDNLDGTAAVIDGRRVTVFASNDYLGLSRHPDVIKAAAEALEKYGTSAGASRLISGNCKPYEELEERLAALKGKEAALVFPTGYMANLGLLTTLAGPRDLIAMDKLNHASLYDAARLSGATVKRYGHNDLDHLKKRLADSDLPGSYRRCLLVTDGVFSADGDLAPLPELAAFARDRRFDLIVDDAHGTGVLGPNGRGTSAHLRAEASVEIGTLSKSIGALGGFIAADRATIELLINKARPFIFTTGLPPATLAGANAALQVMEREPWRRERLLSHSLQIRSSLAGAGFRVLAGPTPIIPIVIGDEKSAVALTSACLDRGLFIPTVRYPTVPKHQARLRLTVSAAHTDEDIEVLLSTIMEVGAEMGLI